ncbi:MAG: hypothetical protein M1831_003273 [Alyxoria varia]|nr:MAG: hypothetical protein M1831_003273 [Alyxoria varia]
MASSRRVALASFKHKQLQRLAFLAGLNSSATKASLLSELPARLQAPLLDSRSLRENKQNYRILSIDMGIRNLAYCMLEVNGEELEKASPRSKRSDRKRGDGDGGMPKRGFGSEDGDAFIKTIGNYSTSAIDCVKLLSWNRISLNSSNGVLNSFESSGRKIRSSINAGPDNDRVEDPIATSEKVQSKEVPKESFEPASLASAAYRLIAHTILPQRPSHILIERQRYRSSGSSAILEWTVRVNMLEGMLHTVLETLKQSSLQKQSPCKGDQSERINDALSHYTSPQVHSVSPKRVANFWTGAMSDKRSSPAQTETGTKKVATSKIEKEAKIAIAETWLQGNEHFKPLQCGSAEGNEMRDAFLVAREPRKSRTRRKTRSMSKEINESDEALNSIDSPTRSAVASLGGKLDDLADSLLQGMAWVQWEANRQKICNAIDIKTSGK